MSHNSDHVHAFVKAWSEGDLSHAVAACGENVTFQIPGKSMLAGKYTRDDFATKVGTAMKERSGGTYKFQAHDTLLSAQHATVLGTASISRSGKHEEYRTVHVFRLENGRPIAWYEYPRDLYAYDAIWGN